MPLLNWQTLKPTQVKDTVFNELDDEQVLGVRNRLFSNMSHLKNSQLNHFSLLYSFAINSASQPGVEHGRI